MTYRLEDLGPHEFEHLVQDLLLKIYGPSVGVFGPGADSGRDATFEGRAAPAADSGGHVDAYWNGYHVFQAKFKERPTTTELDTRWLRAQIQRELKQWTKPDSILSARKPEYIVFLTNVSLSGHVGGGLDATRNFIRSVAGDHGWPLKDCAIWDRSKVERLLDGAADVRQKFNGLIRLFTIGGVVGV